MCLPRQLLRFCCKKIHRRVDCWCNSLEKHISCYTSQWHQSFSAGTVHTHTHCQADDVVGLEFQFTEYTENCLNKSFPERSIPPLESQRKFYSDNTRHVGLHVSGFQISSQIRHNNRNDSKIPSFPLTKTVTTSSRHPFLQPKAFIMNSHQKLYIWKEITSSDPPPKSWWKRLFFTTRKKKLGSNWVLRPNLTHRSTASFLSVAPLHQLCARLVVKIRNQCSYEPKWQSKRFSIQFCLFPHR